MRGTRFLIPFALGAVSMLAVVVTVEWVAPGEVSRIHGALQPGSRPPPDAVPPAESPLVSTPATGDTLPAAPAPVPAPTPAVPVLPADTSAPASAPAPTPGRAGLVVPVQGVERASLVNTYDQARGQGRRHDAIDIMAPRGTPVLAAADGVVMKLFQSARGGITLYELAPDRRTIYYYAHLDRYAPGIAEGQAVRRGQLLGYVGNTGDAGPGNYHLHFEVSTTADPKKYWGGVPQNPYPLLQ